MKTCPTPTDTLHSADTTIWFRLAYGTRVPLWRVIPHRWVIRDCPRALPYAEGWRAGYEQAEINAEPTPTDVIGIPPDEEPQP